jgi:fibronectin type 3 domain-containing protein
VALSWDASTSTVSGYNIYRSTTSGSGYAKLNTTLLITLVYTDSTVVNGKTYFYVATAVDSGGNESVDSNEASAIVP